MSFYPFLNSNSVTQKLLLLLLDQMQSLFSKLNLDFTDSFQSRDTQKSESFLEVSVNREKSNYYIPNTFNLKTNSGSFVKVCTLRASDRLQTRVIIRNIELDSVIISILKFSRYGYILIIKNTLY